MKKILLGAVLSAAVLSVPAAAASRPHVFQLSIVPLPKSAIGPAAAAFPVGARLGAGLERRRRGAHA